jgi:uncharacterized membrane protein
MNAGTTVARGLGLFSMGLGLYQLLAPRQFDELIGVRPHDDIETTTRAIGARELGAAAGLLVSPMPVAFMWMRVAGDMMDLALLGRALNARSNRQDRVGAAMTSVIGITALDVLTSILVTREARNGRNERRADGLETTGSTTLAVSTTGAAGRSRRVVKSITVNRARADLFAFWRDFTNLPRFMHHLESVEVLDADGRRSRWRAKAPLGSTVEWEAEMIDEAPDERISWRSAEASRVHNEGTVSFRDAGVGGATIVHVELEYDPPGGPLGVAIAKLTGEEPETQTSADLRRFKQVMELGEVVVSDATVGGRRLRQRPARPPEQVGTAAV